VTTNLMSSDRVKETQVRGQEESVMGGGVTGWDGGSMTREKKYSVCVVVLWEIRTDYSG